MSWSQVFCSRLLNNIVMTATELLRLVLCLKHSQLIYFVNVLGMVNYRLHPRLIFAETEVNSRKLRAVSERYGINLWTHQLLVWTTLVFKYYVVEIWATRATRDWGRWEITAPSVHHFFPILRTSIPIFCLRAMFFSW